MEIHLVEWDEIVISPIAHDHMLNPHHDDSEDSKIFFLNFEEVRDKVVVSNSILGISSEVAVEQNKKNQKILMKSPKKKR